MDRQNQFGIPSLKGLDEPIRMKQRERLIVAAGEEEMRNSRKVILLEVRTLLLLLVEQGGPRDWDWSIW